ncbi:MAG: glucans biosynthesis glucosyltransferase MdoH [Planctomycetota bacterium]
MNAPTEKLNTVTYPKRHSSMAIRLTRWGVVAITVAATAIATWLYCQSISGMSAWVAWPSVSLFALLFGWIGFSFSLATLGFARQLSQLMRARRMRVDALKLRDRSRLAKSTGSMSKSAGMTNGFAETGGLAIDEADTVKSSSAERTAILIPIYNEDAHRVFAGVRAMIDSLRLTGHAEAFDIYVLSDSTESKKWLDEEARWHQLCQTLGQCDGVCPSVFYRHRRENTARKAGNLADFVRRWGAGYRFMIVLDADSVVSGQTMCQLVSRMQRSPKLGILQAPPRPVGRESLFARTQQFAAYAYGGLFNEGFTAFCGSQSNYWGHNAILRVDAFRQHCMLPVLPGQAPLGGEILSHDFVEAALMLRAGYTVELATDLGESFEECPTTLYDFAIRDQRWCQGNLQHGRLVLCKDFHPLSRWHFASGVMSYASSPLWMLFLGLTLLMVCLPSAETTSGSIPLSLFCCVMGMLLLPKLYAILLRMVRSRRRVLEPSRFGFAISVVAETVVSILVAPVMALLHSWFVINTLAGKAVRWSAQHRGEHGVSWSEATRQFWSLTLVGVVSGAVMVVFRPELLVWFSPLLVGLLLSIPMAVALSSRVLGRWARMLGWLVVPEERRLPAVLAYHQVYLQTDPLAGDTTSSTPDARCDSSPIETLMANPQRMALHRVILDQSRDQLAMSQSDSQRLVGHVLGRRFDAIPETLCKRALSDAKVLERLEKIRQEDSSAG